MSLRERYERHRAEGSSDSRLRLSLRELDHEIEKCDHGFKRKDCNICAVYPPSPPQTLTEERSEDE